LNGLPGQVPMAEKKVCSVWRNLYLEDRAAEMAMRSFLLESLAVWLAETDLPPTQAVKILEVTQAWVSDLKRGKITPFSLDLLVRLASRRGPA
jgi:predicted XRE-type DNA-binding protein